MHALTCFSEVSRSFAAHASRILVLGPRDLHPLVFKEAEDRKRLPESAEAPSEAEEKAPISSPNHPGG